MVTFRLVEQKDHLKQLLEEKGIKSKNYRTYICRMIERELIMKHQGGYKKIETRFF